MLKFKPAFTMIELIFAIVIIGISVLSLPMVAQVTSTNIEKNLVQEAILIASTDMTKVISGKWDENSRDKLLLAAEPNNYESIIYTSDAEVTTYSTVGKRKGNINIKFHSNTSFRPTSGVDTDENASDTNTFDDVDDWNLFSGDATKDDGSSTGYKNKYTKEIDVINSSSFGTLNNDNNIKKVEITIKNSDSKKLVKLHTYVINNGSSPRPSTPIRKL